MQLRKWIIPIVLVSGLIFVLSLRQLSDPDLGFHLKYGKWITENHQVPLTDLSTYTVPGHDYVDMHWLFQVILYSVFLLAGYPGISIFICLLALALSLMIMIRNRLAGVPLAVTCLSLLAGFLIIDPRIAPRPEMFSFIFLTGIVFILDSYALSQKNHLWLIPVIMLFWCNMHALFILGLVIFAVCFLSSWLHERKADMKALPWLAVSFLVCFINPYGFRGFSFPFELLTRFDPHNVYNQHIQEFMPFWAQPRFVTGDYLFMALVGLTLVLTAITLRARKVHEIVLLTVFALLAFGSIRNVPLFVLIALPVVSREVGELNKRVAFFWEKTEIVFFILLIIIPILLIPRLITNAYYAENNSFNKTGMGINPLHQPVGAAMFIRQHYPQTRILNSIGYGGWLSWALPQPVFIDGRLEVMQESLYGEITKSWNGGLPSLVSCYKPGLIIYNYLKYYPWTLQLKDMPGWRLVYLDEGAAIFTADTIQPEMPPVDLSSLPSKDILKARKPSWAWTMGFYLPAGDDLAGLQHKALFGLQMNAGIKGKRNPSDALAFFKTAGEKYKRGDYTGALACYDTAIALNPGHIKAWINRGILRASALKDFNGAIADFNHAIEADPRYGDAWLGRGTAWFYLHDLKAACNDWNRALSLGNVQASRLIGLHCNGK